MSTDSLRTWYELVRRLGLGPDVRPFDPDEAWDAYVDASSAPDRADAPSCMPDAGRREGRTESISIRRTRARILAALAELEPVDRDVLIQRVFEERDFAAIAESRGCGRDAALDLYARAVSKLQALLSRASESRSGRGRSGSADGLLDDYEKRALLAALQQTGGDRSAASRWLGVGKATFYRKLKFHGLA